MCQTLLNNDDDQMSNQNSQPTNAEVNSTIIDGTNILLDWKYNDFSFLGFSTVSNESQYKNIYDAPTTFDEAWDHKDAFQRGKWREAIQKGIKQNGEAKGMGCS
jgi:hypothetical protein